MVLLRELLLFLRQIDLLSAVVELWLIQRALHSAEIELRAWRRQRGHQWLNLVLLLLLPIQTTVVLAGQSPGCQRLQTIPRKLQVDLLRAELPQNQTKIPRVAMLSYCRKDHQTAQVGKLPVPRFQRVRHLQEVVRC